MKKDRFPKTSLEPHISFAILRRREKLGKIKEFHFSYIVGLIFKCDLN